MLVDPLTPNGDAAATNFNPFNTDINTVRGQESGYCTINPLDGYVSTKDGNLETSTSSGWQGIRATLGMNSGKFYWETQNNQDAAAILGIADSDATGFVDGSIFGSTGHGGGDANPAYTWAGANYYFNATTAGTGLSNHVPSDVVQYAFDADSGKLWFGRNGVWYNSSWGTTGNPAGGSNATVSGINTTKTYLACASFYNGSGKFNFGQKPFKFPPPAGFSPLNAANARPETVITRPDQFVGVVAYTGTTGAGTIKDDNIKFTPDFVWLKSRSNSEGHALYDTVRGSTGGNFYRLRSDTTAAENSPTNELSSMIRGGFTVNNNGHCYYNGYTYVAWTWKAGGNKNTFNVDDVGYASAAAAGLDGGTINPTGASVGTKQGFSIIKYTGNQTDGATVSHGLGKIPHFIIVKSITDGTYEWGTLNVTPGTSTGFSGGNLNNTETVVDLSNGSRRAQSWHAAPTSSVFSLGADGSSYTGTYNNNQDYIAYVWCDIPGLQKFGQYTGNGNTNGPFVELGFRPSLLIVKCATASGASNNWAIIDSTRSFANVGNHTLAWNSAGAESAFGDGASVGGASNKIDLLSNGFKMRDSGAFGNTDGDTYVYAAWAEAPAFNLYGGQSNAR